MDTKVTAVIVNATKQGLAVKVGNRQCYARLTSVKVGGEYKIQIDVNWTYQEFLVEDKGDAPHNQLFVSSDDCCEYERITVKGNVDGTFDVQREIREQLRSGSSSCATPDQRRPTVDGSWKSWLHKLM